MPIVTDNILILRRRNSSNFHKENVMTDYACHCGDSDVHVCTVILYRGETVRLPVAGVWMEVCAVG